MIYLRHEDSASAPVYMTAHSAGADVKSRIAATIAPQTTTRIPTGLWIDRVDWDAVPPTCIPEIQVRARSGLAYKHSIMLTNGVGTIDADYRDEICILLYNGGTQPFTINPGDRIAQLVLQLCYRLPEVPIHTAIQRQGGFGSTASISG